MPKLITRNIWDSITSAARKSKGYVAVAYFGKSASKLLPLKSGSVLVVDMSDSAVKSGQTCPGEVIKLIKRGVDVYSVGNLHAKVFAFTGRAFIGSTNVSRNSAHGLVEAVLEVSDQRTIGDVKSFVCSLAGERVDINFAKIQDKKYKPPRYPRSNVSPDAKPDVPTHHTVRIVELENYNYSDEEMDAANKGEPIARRKLKNTRLSKIDDFAWPGRCPFIIGDITIQVVHVGKRIMVQPPGHVVYVRKTRTRNAQSHVIFLEVAKRSRSRDIKTLKSRLDKSAINALMAKGAKVITDPAMKHDILYALNYNISK